MAEQPGPFGRVEGEAGDLQRGRVSGKQAAGILHPAGPGFLARREGGGAAADPLAHRLGRIKPGGFFPLPVLGVVEAGVFQPLAGQDGREAFPVRDDIARPVQIQPIPVAGHRDIGRMAIEIG